MESHAYDLNLFVDTWAGLWKKFSCLPNFQRDLANRIFIDVMNEPDSMNIKWEAQDGRPGAQQLYLGVADALWALTPGKVMFFFEGEHRMLRLNTSATVFYCTVLHILHLPEHYILCYCTDYDVLCCMVHCVMYVCTVTCHVTACFAVLYLRGTVL